MHRRRRIHRFTFFLAFLGRPPMAENLLPCYPEGRKGRWGRWGRARVGKFENRCELVNVNNLLILLRIII
jgi:hypothetical protein